ncbi:hypothetical protein [Streptomyces nigrescens]
MSAKRAGGACRPRCPSASERRRRNGTPSSSTPPPPIPSAAAEPTPAGCASPPARTATSWPSTRTPARNGRPGQLIRTGRDYDEGPAYLADSVTALLGRYLELLDQGAYERHGDHISLLEPAGDPAPRQIIGEIPDEVPPTLQEIHINNATALVDLAPLTSAPHLRRLHLNRSTTADLTPVRELLVESLCITLDDGNLTPLAGHPHLASLDLTTTVPTDLPPCAPSPTCAVSTSPEPTPPTRRSSST